MSSQQEQLYTSTNIFPTFAQETLPRIRKALAENPSVMLDHRDSFYLNSSDPIAALYRNVDASGKNVATVAGSGSFAELFFDRGAVSVDIFDTSPFAAFWTELKLSTAASLSREECRLFFGKGTAVKRKHADNWNETTKTFLPIPIFDRDLYPRVRPALSAQAAACFDLLLTPAFATLFHLTDKREYFGFARPRDFDFVEDFTSEETYPAFQKRVREGCYSLHVEDVETVARRVKDVHIVYLSNIGRNLERTAAVAARFRATGAQRILFTCPSAPEATSSHAGTVRYALDANGIMRDRSNPQEKALLESQERDRLATGRFDELIPGNILRVGSEHVRILEIQPNVYYGTLAELA